jgi:hypothetical protein
MDRAHHLACNESASSKVVYHESRGMIFSDRQCNSRGRGGGEGGGPARPATHTLAATYRSGSRQAVACLPIDPMQPSLQF